MVKILQHLNEYIIGIVWIISLMDTLVELEKACWWIKIKQLWVIITFYVHCFATDKMYHFQHSVKSHFKKICTADLKY